MSLTPGQVIDDKYRIVRLLGTGGMGAVYEGENTRIRRRVAIKVLHASVSGSADTVARFEREAQAAGRIGSEHICEVLDLGHLPDSSRYMVMEYLDGETLSARIKRFGRLAPDQSIALMTQVLDALFAAHNAGIVHRDLKPDNIFILPNKAGRTDFIKILDFGVSKFSQLGGEEMNVTRAGSVVGTPYYMSPEQARGMAVVDARSDIYALGVVLYQATTGQVPFRAETFNELLFKIALELPPPPHQFVPDLDQDFAQIIQRAMAREQINRFQTCAEFKETLLSWQASRAGAGASAGPTMQPPRAPTAPPGLYSAPVAVPMAQSGVQAFIPGTTTPAPGVLQAVLPPGTPLEGAHPTANAWGNTSGAGPQGASKPKNSGALVGALVSLVLVAGLGVAGYFVFVKKDPNAQAGGSIASSSATSSATTSAAPTTPVVASAAPTNPTPEEPPVAPPPAESAAASPSVPVTAPQGSLTGKTTKAGTVPTTKSSTTNTIKKSGGADFGY